MAVAAAAPAVRTHKGYNAWVKRNSSSAARKCAALLHMRCICTDRCFAAAVKYAILYGKKWGGHMATGVPREMIDFFLALRFNNNQAFFDENRKLYENVVQKPLRTIAEELGPTLNRIDPQLDVRPQRVVSRIRRDTRFSHNKDPFRDHMWLSWRYPGEMTGDAMGFYWEIGPEVMHWGFGYYGEHKPTMDRVRRRILSQPRELIGLLAQCGVPERFQIQGEAYKRLAVPPEVPEELQALYIKKGFYFMNSAGEHDFDALFSGELVERVSQDYLSVAPLYDWMRGRQMDEPEGDHPSGAGGKP